MAGNHAPADASKRLAPLATVVSLWINDHTLDLPDSETCGLTMAVATGQPDAGETHKRLRLAQAPP